MAGSKPEELVAKLYEEGMTDDEVRAQLVEFGLSGREIHVLVKKAKDLQEAQKKAGSKANTKKIPAQPAYETTPQETPSPPKDTLLAAGLPSHGAAKKADEKKSGDNKTEKKPLFGLFGKKKEARAKEGDQANEGEVKAEPGETTPPEPVKLNDADKVDRLRELMGSGAREVPSEEKPALSMPATAANGETKAGEKKPRLSLFGKKKEGASKESKESKETKENKEDKGHEGRKADKAKTKQDKGSPTREDVQAKMKRLAIIKEAISKPVVTATRPAAADTTSAALAKLSEGAKAAEIVKPSAETVSRTPIGASAQAAQSAALNQPKAQKQLTKKTLEDEEKMDEEIAKALLEGMKNLENEMGEVKQLLETLRELNIKLIEIMESK